MNDLERRIATADPMRETALHPLPDGAVRALVKEAMMHRSLTPHPSDLTPVAPAGVRRPRNGRRKRRSLAAAALIAAGAIAVPSAAFAVVAGGMHSGQFGGSNDTEDVPGEEWLYTDDPAIRDVVADLASERPLPPGATYDALLARYPEQSPERTLEQRSGLAQVVQFYAACAWYRDWATGGAGRRSADQATIDAIPDWPHWRFAPDQPAGSGRDLLRKVAAETERGDATTLTMYVRANC